MTPPRIAQHDKRITALWNVRPETIIRWFQDVPGVLKLSKPARNGKRTSVELRYRLA